jgi:hypothetical protein
LMAPADRLELGAELGGNGDNVTMGSDCCIHGKGHHAKESLYLRLDTCYPVHLEVIAG